MNALHRSLKCTFLDSRLLFKEFNLWVLVSNSSSIDSFARLPAALVPAACMPGHPGLRCCCQGGQEAGWARGPGGAGLRLRRLFQGWILGNDRRFLLLLGENYNLSATDRTAEAQSTRRTNGRRRLLLRDCELFFKCLQISRLRGSANSAALRLIIVAGELKSEVTRRKTQRCKKRTETFWQTSRLSPASLSLRTVG